MEHLWEVEHPYYCNEDHHFGTGSASYADMHPKHRSWDEFMSNMGDADMDYNLLFRWDWEEPEERPEERDDNYRDGTLKLTYFAQRKGFHIQHEIEVCRADEPLVVAFLQEHLQHMMKLWAPLFPETPHDN